MSKFIKSIHSSGHNILIVNNQNELYAVGDNTYGKINPSSKETNTAELVHLGIRLEAEECIVEFMSYIANVCIYTSHQRLFFLKSNNSSRDPVLGQTKISQSDSDETDTDQERGSDDSECLSDEEDASEAQIANRTLIEIPFEPPPEIEQIELIDISDQEKDDVKARKKKDDEITETSSSRRKKKKNSSETQMQNIITNFLYMTISEVQEMPIFEIGSPYAKNWHVVENVSGVIFGMDNPMFQIGDDTFVEIFNIVNKFSPDRAFQPQLSQTLVDPERNRWQIHFPFDADIRLFSLHFMYLRSGNVHHVVIPTVSDIMKSTLVKWIYFRADFDISLIDIHWSSVDETIYVVNKDTIYIYQSIDGALTPFMQAGVIYFFMDRLFYEDFYVVDECGYYQGLYTKKIGSAIPLPIEKIYILDTSSTQEYDIIKLTSVPIVIYKYKDTSTREKRVSFYDDLISVNVKGLRYWGMLDDSCFVYIENNYLWIIGSTLRPWWNPNLEWVSRSQFPCLVWCRNILPVAEKEIENVSFDGSLVIQTKYEIYCFHVFKKFELYPLTLESSTDITSNSMINMSLINKQKYPNFSNHWAVSIQSSDISLIKFMTLAEMIPINMGIEVSYTDAFNKVSIGDGVKVTFCEQAMLQLADTYFITHNILSELNLSVLNKYTDTQLYVFGKTIALAYNTMKNFLPIRLPLILLAAIQRRIPSIEDLEWFSRHEDPEAYHSLRTIRDDSEAIQESGFDSYEAALKFLCKFDNQGPQLYPKARLIANGIIYHTHIRNLTEMNLPTLDYCFSGSYDIDVERFISQINMEQMRRPYRERFHAFIHSLNQEQLASLLFNWSGSRVPNRNLTYHVASTHDTDHVVQFSICTQHMFINTKLFKEYDQEMWNVLLTQQCNVMRE